jgi:hypothetical protein
MLGESVFQFSHFIQGGSSAEFIFPNRGRFQVKLDEQGNIPVIHDKYIQVTGAG